MKSPITTHVLDTMRGVPADGIRVTLEFQKDTERWSTLANGTTDGDGRIGNLLPPDATLEPGFYRLTFQTGEYFQAKGLKGFYPSVVVTFEITSPGSHYHVPLLLSPFGYTTYRGS